MNNRKLVVHVPPGFWLKNLHIFFVNCALSPCRTHRVPDVVGLILLVSMRKNYGYVCSILKTRKACES